MQKRTVLSIFFLFLRCEETYLSIISAGCHDVSPHDRLPQEGADTGKRDVRHRDAMPYHSRQGPGAQQPLLDLCNARHHRERTHRHR